MELIHKKVNELVANNSAIAKALHFLGIRFYNYSEQTIEQICAEKGLEPERVEQKLIESVSARNKPATPNLVDFPIDLIIAYLKHSHYLFIKDKLYFITDLVSHLNENSSDLAKELKMVYPHFLEDFIHHIYEEEDHVFGYMLALQEASHEAKADVNGLRKRFDAKSIPAFEAEHHHDDELKGIREITHDFDIKNLDLHTRVLVEALKSFNDELKVHAKIENEILFPKAKEIEKQLIDRQAKG
jgi:regulator of cell morphogenesis and NO signaling